MVVGFRAQDRERRLIGIDTAADVELTRRAVTKIVLATAELIGLKREIRDQDILIESRYSGQHMESRTKPRLRLSGSWLVLKA